MCEYLHFNLNLGGNGVLIQKYSKDPSASDALDINLIPEEDLRDPHHHTLGLTRNKSHTA